MHSIWTDDEIGRILLQLNKKGLPFSKYPFTVNESGNLDNIGTGGYSNVYAAAANRVIKVVGFGEKDVSIETFVELAKAQKEIAFLQSNIVKVYEYAVVGVSFNDNFEIEKASVIDVNGKANHIEVNNSEEEIISDNYCELKFLLMERLDPILMRDSSNNQLIIHEIFKEEQKKEDVFQLAYELAVAIQVTHNHSCLHRDIKLDNIFYDKKTKHYKLGDFGIAKITEDGFASNMALTRGYGAPEIENGSKSSYDCTADIYSFGVVLFLLTNKFMFPGSTNFSFNREEQYQKGYVFPSPRKEFEELDFIIKKMCAYDPDDRHQNIDELLDDLNGVIVNKDITQQKKHKKSSLLWGTVFLFLATILGKMAFKPDMVLDLSIWAYIFLAATLLRGILNLYKKSSILCGLGVFGIGIYLIASTGFSWLKLIGFIILIMYAEMSLQIAGMAIIIELVNVFSGVPNLINGSPFQMFWIPTLFLSWATVLLINHMVLNDNDPNTLKKYFDNNKYWKFVLAIYLLLAANGFFLKTVDDGMIPQILIGLNRVHFYQSLELTKVGIFGATFTVLWRAREYYTFKYEKNMKKI